ncbi:MULTISPECIES: sugar ABC transporter substrate-binding protein [unclassified Actinotalea]|uniref:ABC transporter substrate-binding protein n=1 Tax=unclassified Actinotalea TaxID=2638618 RepID=UPI0015F56731|nr:MULTISPECIES: sugar ABC transporter substrate-binding protein [unclassified Actinotalea]
MNLSRRQLLGIGGGIAAGIALAACGGGGGSSSGGGGGGGKPGTLRIWANAAVAGDADSGLQRAAKAFGEAKGMTVQVEGLPTADLVSKLTTAVSGGSGPDVAIVDSSSVPQLAGAQILADLTDRTGGVAGDFHTGAMEYSTYAGKQYGLPYYTNNVGLFYNKAMLSDAGIEVPTTWQDLRSAAIELTGGDRYGYMMGPAGYGAFLFWPWLWQNGGQIVDADATRAVFDDDKGIEAFEFYANLHLEDAVVPPDFLAATSGWDPYVAPFAQERVAMMAIGPWGQNAITEGNPDLDWGVAPLPQGSEKATILGGATIGVAANAGAPDEAWEFVEWVTGGEQMEFIQASGNIPGRKDVIDSAWATEDPVRQVFVEQMEFARARPALPTWGDVEWGVFANAWDSVIQGQASPADALRSAAEQATEKLSS